MRSRRLRGGRGAAGARAARARTGGRPRLADGDRVRSSSPSSSVSLSAEPRAPIEGETERGRGSASSSAVKRRSALSAARHGTPRPGPSSAAGRGRLLREKSSCGRGVRKKSETMSALRGPGARAHAAISEAAGRRRKATEARRPTTPVEATAGPEGPTGILGLVAIHGMPLRRFGERGCPWISLSLAHSFALSTWRRRLQLETIYPHPPRGADAPASSPSPTRRPGRTAPKRGARSRSGVESTSFSAMATPPIVAVEVANASEPNVIRGKNQPPRASALDGRWFPRPAPP